MKKFLAKILAVTLIFCLFSGCNDSSDKIPENSDALEETTAPELNEALDNENKDIEEETMVKVTINKDKVKVISNLSLGVTHTHYYWEKGNISASLKAKELFKDFSRFNNQHIMGWGADNPWPSKESPMNFTSLDARIALFNQLEGEPIITFCQAPGWMKEADDWAMENAVKDEYNADFAFLCAEIAKRYPKVKYFQIWNEFKGYWSAEKKRWDYERYTVMYNEVYKAVKEVRPDALIGGFYLVIEGDGSNELFGYIGTHDFMPLDKSTIDAINYWNENKIGADYFCIDRGIKEFHNDFELTPEQSMELTNIFGKVINEICDMTDLPIIISEYYGHGIDKDGSLNMQLDAAQYASILYNFITNADGREIIALSWNEKAADLRTGVIFTDTDTSRGGEPFPLYDIFSGISNYFPKGTKIYQSQGSSGEVLVLAGEQKAMLVNTRDMEITVSINGDKNINLEPFGVIFTDI